MMDVQIKPMPELRVGAVRHAGPYDQIPVAFGRLGAIAGPAGLFAQPDAEMIAIYHDDPDAVPQDQLKSDAAIAVPEKVPLPRGLVEASNRPQCSSEIIAGLAISRLKRYRPLEAGYRF